MLLEHLYTKEEKAIRSSIREFVNKEIMPVRRELEDDPALVKSILQKLVDMGIQEGGFPPDYGGTGPYTMVARGIIQEELARADPGIAMTNGINAGELLGPAFHAGNKVVTDKFAPAFCGKEVRYACLAMTDSAGGADTENPVLEGRGISTTAELDGDEWVINGSKSWPTNAGVADFYMTVCNTDIEAGEDGIALIYVPADAPGLSFGKPEEKMGFRSAINASIYYDNVRVPKEYRLAGPGVDAQFYQGGFMGLAQWAASLLALGIMQGAFDIALEYTGERKSGGRPVREWSLAAGTLADMAVRIKLLRAAALNLAYMYDHPEEYGNPLTKQMISNGSALRVFASESCVFVVNKAVQLMGANGISKDYDLEKYARDALVNEIYLGGMQVTRYRIVRGYYDYSVK